MQMIHLLFTAVDGEYCGSEHSVHWRHRGPGVPPNCSADAVAQPHHGLSGLPGSCH